MSRPYALVTSLSVIISVLALIPRAAGAAETPVVDLRLPAWSAFLDGSGDPAAAAMNTSVLNHVLANVTPGSWVILPDDAVYATSGVIRIPVDRTVVTGTATIRSLNLAASAVYVRGSMVHISGLRIHGSATLRNQRRSNPESHGFVIIGNGNTLTDIRVSEVAGSGIITLGAKLFRVIRPVVVNTQADGVHMTSASAYGLVESPIVFGAGDDGVAVVSYVDNAAPTAHITVNDPVVYMSNAPPNYPYTYAWGRGFTVSGGTDITFNNVTSINSAGAGIYIAAEPESSWNTDAVARVRVNGGTLVNSNIDRTLCANPNAGCIDHGAVLVWSAQAGRGIDDVRIEGLTIRDTNSSASRQASILVANGGSVARVLLRDLIFSGGPSTTFWAGASVPSDAYTSICLTVAPSTILTNHLGYQPIPEPGVTCGSPAA